MQRAKDIFELIDKEEGSFPKSKLKDVGLNPDTAEKWLDLIEFIQRQPRIHVIKTERNTVVEKKEGKFSQMSLKFFLDDTQPLEKRLQSLEAYADSVLVQERLQKTE